MKQRVKSIASEKGIDFKINIDENVPVQIYTDAGRLSQCLINLTNNSIKFTEKGHVHVHISLENDPDSKPCIRFDVEDTGIGINPKDMDMIFESFSQADYSSTRKHGGTGLGLAITKQLIALLGGELILASEEGKGSVFTLVVPIGIDMKAEQPQPDKNVITVHADQSTDISEQPEYSGHVLVAEDIKPSQFLIKVMLNKMNFRGLV